MIQSVNLPKGRHLPDILGQAGSWHVMAGWVILMCLVWRALIPVGFMPAGNTDSIIGGFTICSGLTPAADTGPYSPDSDPAHAAKNQMCPFVILTAPAIPGPLLVGLIEAPGHTALRLPVWSYAGATAPATLARPDVRGPPAHA